MSTRPHYNVTVVDGSSGDATAAVNAHKIEVGAHAATKISVAHVPVEYVAATPDVEAHIVGIDGVLVDIEDGLQDVIDALAAILGGP